MEEFITPPDHVKFKAKKLFGEMGKIKDGAIAYIQPNGGGPTAPHVHKHSHLFIVLKGEAKIILDDKEIIVGEQESFVVDGQIPHSVWNNSNDNQAVVLGISVGEA